MPNRPATSIRPRLRSSISAVAIAALAIGGGAVAAVPASAASGEISPLERVIVELAGPAAIARFGDNRVKALREVSATSRNGEVAEYRAVTAEVERVQNDFVAAAGQAGIALADAENITGVLNAVVADVDSTQLDALRAMPGVARVTVDKRVGLFVDGGDDGGDGGDGAEGDRTSGPAVEPAPTRPIASPEAEAPEASAPETTAPEASAPEASAPETTAPDVAIPADADLGAGVTVAIIDTGVDYTLADLGGGFGDGYTVVDGYDFVNVDGDPMDDHFHGTHVAGIVAGQGVDSVTGVAPDVELTAWKALNDGGEGYESWILSAIEAAVDPGGAHPADVVNMSLGGDGDGTDPIGTAAANAVASGVLVVAAAGNAGPGEATIGTPAAAPGVIAVGASVTDYRAAIATLEATEDSPESRRLDTWRVVFSANPAAGDITAPIVDVGEGTPKDFDRVGDVTGRIVAYRGDAPRSMQDYFGMSLPTAQLAEQKGALAALVYLQSPLDEDAAGGVTPFGTGADDSTEGTGSTDGIAEVEPSGSDALASGDDLRLDDLVVFGLSASEYALVQEAGDDVELTISSVDATDEIASFSSRGPTRTGVLKPEIVAPGYEIRSTIPAWQGVPENAYRLSGTSMASPEVAGIAAIARAVHPELDAAQVRALLIGSANPLAGASADLSPSLQGSGRADVESVTGASVGAFPDTLSFGQADGDGDTAAPALSTSLVNLSDEPVSVHLEVRPSASSAGTLTLDTQDLTIDPGTDASVTATAAASLLPTDSELSGEIVATVSDGTTVRIPYLQVLRHITVVATPQPTTGDAQLMLESFLPLDAAPVLTVTGEDGVAFDVLSAPSASMPGWYRADVSVDDIGVYDVTVRGEGRGNGLTILGAGSFEKIAPATSDVVWEQVGRNGSSAELEVSPVAPGTAMQRTSTSARPFVTTDHGDSWRQVNSLPVADGQGTLIADPVDGDAFWYAINGAAGYPPLDPSYEAKLLRTEDLGTTWQILPMRDVHVEWMAHDGASLVAVVGDGLEISPDGGATWSHLAYTWGEYITGAVVSDGDLFVSSFGSVWKIASVFGEPTSPEIVHSTDEVSFSGIAAGGGTVALSGYGAVTVSRDGGDTWTATDFPEEQYTAGIRFVDSDLYVSGLAGYWRSVDDGRTWLAHPYPVNGAVGIDFDAWPDREGSIILPLENAGLYSSNDEGETFTRIGVPATTIDDVLATTDASGRPRLYVADEQGVGSTALPTRERLADDVEEWGVTGGEARYGEQAEDVEQDATHGDTLWRTHLNASFVSRMQVTTDAGGTWSDIGPTSFGLSINDLEASPAVGGHVVAAFTDSGDTGLLVTNDGWQHWEVYSHPAVFRTVAIDPGNDSRLWLAADDGLYRSDDGGRTVTRVFEDELATVYIDPEDSSRILAGGRGLWTSTDGGGTFTEADAGGADMYVSSLTSAEVRLGRFGSKTVLFAGTTTFRPGPFWVLGRGVLSSIDGGKTWQNVSAGLANTSVVSMDASDDGVWLFVGTRQGGVYRARVTDLVVVGLLDQLPEFPGLPSLPELPSLPGLPPIPFWPRAT